MRAKKIIFLVFITVFVFFGFINSVEAARKTIADCPIKKAGQNCGKMGNDWYFCGGQCRQQPPANDPGEPWSLDCETCQWQCASPNIVCDGKCQAKFAQTGQACDSPKNGKYDDCGKCLCSPGQENCDGICKNEKGKPCQINGKPGTYTDVCGKNCVAAPRPAVFFGPYGKQSENLDRPAISLNQLGSGRLLELSQAGAERFVVSNAGDVFLSDAKAIRVDRAGGVGVLNIGNWAANAKGIAVNILGDLQVGDNNFNRKLTVFGNLQATKKISAESIDVQGRIMTKEMVITGLENCLLGVNDGGQLECREITLKETDPFFDTWQKNFEETDPKFVGWREQGQPELKNLKITENLLVNNQLVCLGDGRNCPAMKDADWQAWQTNLDRTLDGDLNLNNGTLVAKEIKVNGGLVCTTANNRCAGGEIITEEPEFTAWKNDPRLNKLEITEDLKVGGCFGPVFAGVTDTAYDGNRGGYKNADGICGIQYSGSHICTTAEILNSIHCGKTLPNSGEAWIFNGPPAFLAQANDCDGWTNTDSAYGAKWIFDERGGKGYLTGCNTMQKFACCK